MWWAHQVAVSYYLLNLTVGVMCLNYSESVREEEELQSASQEEEMDDQDDDVGFSFFLISLSLSLSLSPLSFVFVVFTFVCVCGGGRCTLSLSLARSPLSLPPSLLPSLAPSRDLLFFLPCLPRRPALPLFLPSSASSSQPHSHLDATDKLCPTHAAPGKRGGRGP